MSFCFHAQEKKEEKRKKTQAFDFYARKYILLIHEELELCKKGSGKPDRRKQDTRFSASKFLSVRSFILILGCGSLGAGRSHIRVRSLLSIAGFELLVHRRASNRRCTGSWYETPSVHDA